MTDLAEIREQLAERRENGNYEALTMTLTLKPRQVQIQAVSSDDDQVFVKYEDGLTEAVNAEEIEDLA